MLLWQSCRAAAAHGLLTGRSTVCLLRAQAAAPSLTRTRVRVCVRVCACVCDTGCAWPPQQQQSVRQACTMVITVVCMCVCMLLQRMRASAASRRVRERPQKAVCARPCLLSCWSRCALWLCAVLRSRRVGTARTCVGIASAVQAQQCVWRRPHCARGTHPLPLATLLRHDAQPAPAIASLQGCCVFCAMPLCCRAATSRLHTDHAHAPASAQSRT